MKVTHMNMSQLLIGLSSGLFVGLALASHSISRALVVGLIAGVVISAIMLDGVDGYLSWVTYIPTEITKFTTFWIGMIAGCLAGAAIGWIARATRLR